MGRTFRYIQNDDVLKSFREFQDSILSERPVVIARHGDYTLQMEKLEQDLLGLKIINNEKNKVVSSRSYDVKNTTDALVSRGVRHACQKMSELSDEAVNRKRLQIWKWYVLEWQKAATRCVTKNKSEITPTIQRRCYTRSSAGLRMALNMNRRS